MKKTKIVIGEGFVRSYAQNSIALYDFGHRPVILEYDIKNFSCSCDLNKGHCKCKPWKVILER